MNLRPPGYEPDELTTALLRDIKLKNLVPRTGVEPVQCCHRGILSPLRLPIPPSRQVYGRVNSKAGHYAPPLTLAPEVGLEPTAYRLTAGCSAIELLRNILAISATTISIRKPVRDVKVYFYFFFRMFRQYID